MREEARVLVGKMEILMVCSFPAHLPLFNALLLNQL